MKRVLFCLLMSVMIVLSSFPAITFAEETNITSQEISTEGIKDLLVESDTSKSQIASESKEIKNEVEILNAFGYDSNTITNANVECGEVIYRIEAKGAESINDVIEAEVAITETAYGDVTLNFTEDAQKAALVFTNDGKIFLDGDEIVITEDEDPSLDGSAIYRTSTVPYGCGSESKYTYYGGPRYWNIEFHDFICKTLVTVCAAVIVTAMTGNIKASAAMATSSGIIGYASSSDGKALSAKSIMYYNIDYKQFMISSSQGCRKEYTDFYSTGSYSRKMNKTPLISYYYFMMPGC